MKSFWFFARGLRSRPGLLATAISMALLSAVSLGVGILALLPTFRTLLDPKSEGRDLADILAKLAAQANITLPQPWLDTLPEGPFNAILIIFLGLGVLTIVGGTATFLHSYISLTIIQNTILDIRKNAFDRVVRLPLSSVIRDGAADKASRIVNDTSALEIGFTALLSRATVQLFKGLAALAAAAIAQWAVTAGAFVLGFVLYHVIRRLSKRIRRASKAALAEQAGLYGTTMESLQGLRVVKVYTAENFETDRFHRISREVMRHMLRVRTARALSSPLIEVLSLFILGTVFLIVVNNIIQGALELDRSLVALGALFTAGASLKPLSGLINDIQGSAGAAQRLQELLDAPTEPGHDASLPTLAPLTQSLAFDSLTFTYPGADRPALEQIDLTIRSGERVAIVGPNGSGKTTLLGLVPRLFDPQQGRVLIDGRDIRECSIESLRAQVGVVTQETIIFRTTIRANIAYGRADASDAQITAAARQARAHEFIERIPGSYDAQVGDQGLTLSGGQRQRIAIARAILRDPAILILDEATSMIDADSEARIGEALAEFTQGRTCLIVAHRLSTVMGADRIIVMDAARVVDQGTHPELLKRCETYKLIARTQLGFDADSTE